LSVLDHWGEKEEGISYKGAKNRLDIVKKEKSTSLFSNSYVEYTVVDKTSQSVNVITGSSKGKKESPFLSITLGNTKFVERESPATESMEIESLTTACPFASINTSKQTEKIMHIGVLLSPSSVLFSCTYEIPFFETRRGQAFIVLFILIATFNLQGIFTYILKKTSNKTTTTSPKVDPILETRDFYNQNKITYQQALILLRRNNFSQEEINELLKTV